MKLAKVWYDWDDERYCREVHLFEEDRDKVLNNQDRTVITDDFMQKILDGHMVAFADPQTGQLFGLRADRIVKIQILEE